MSEKAPILGRNVKKETERHYKGGWPINADARRYLYLKYAKYPKEIAELRGEKYIEREPTDMWKDIAETVIENIGDTEDKIGLDVGTSSGYFIPQLINAGYKGSIVGVDIETGYQPFLYQQLNIEYPDSNILLGGGNAESLRNLEIKDDDGEVINSLEIRKNSVDFLTELFILYHVPNVVKAYNAAHRVLKPNGLAIFSGRDRQNQSHIWNLGAIIAQEFKVEAPESFYTHHGLKDIEDYLKVSPKFELVDVVRQADHIWIPALVEGGDKGWDATKLALASLPYGINEDTGRSIVNKDFLDYLDNVVRKDYFEAQAAANNGYFVDYVFQNYYVCRAIK